jgi:hypothetical protein
MSYHAFHLINAPTPGSLSSTSSHSMSKAAPKGNEPGGRCYACQRIPWRYEEWPDETPVGIEHHNFFADLEASAASCFPCRSFRAVVYYSLRTINLYDPPPGRCTLWLPKESSIDLATAVERDGSGPNTSPAVIRFYIGHVLFLPILTVNGFGSGIESVVGSSPHHDMSRS